MISFQDLKTVECNECFSTRKSENFSKLDRKLSLIGNLKQECIEEEITEECQEDSKSQKNQEDKKKMDASSSGNFNQKLNLRGGFKKSTRGRNRKVGTTKVTNSKGRGRRSVLKKQVIYLGVFLLL